MSATTVQIRGKGVITLPKELRRRYGLNEGDVLTMVDLGEGSFVITPRLLQISRLGDQVSQALSEAAATVDDLLLILEEERERYYREQYVQD
jgi:AbrB family looped-hinge helix DNA binding protein